MSQNTIKCRETGRPVANKLDGGRCACPMGVCHMATVWAADDARAAALGSLEPGRNYHDKSPQELLAKAELAATSYAQERATLHNWDGDYELDEADESEEELAAVRWGKVELDGARFRVPFVTPDNWEQRIILMALGAVAAAEFVAAQREARQGRTAFVVLRLAAHDKSG